MSTDIQKANLEIWIAALRSGEYKQGHYQLFTEFPDCTFGYCCLGVATKVLGITNESEKGNPNIIYGDIDPYFATEIDEDFFRNLFGLEKDTQHRLMVFNDMDGKDFQEIADHLELIKTGKYIEYYAVG
jgi:hypothetical protein